MSELTKSAVKIWKKIARHQPVLISGPCSAETENQVLQTAQSIARLGKVDMLRAGIWKPRTQPGSFEGVGKRGLHWLEKSRDITGLPFAIEVAKAEHVEAALKHEADMLWIGARTTANPFSVQEIADALQGVEIPVWVKNPVNPDLKLWIGGLERIKKSGIERLGAIHRGFSSFGNTEYRNAPMWHIPIELKRLQPQLPLICDPSHICGRRDILGDVSQKAIDLDYDGLMIEAHCQPDQAWSDAKQQVSPQQLKSILENLIWRKKSIDKDEFVLALNKLRNQINLIDDELLSLLARRMEISEKIGHYKKENAVTILQTKRWREIVEKTIAKGEKHGLDKEFIRKLLEAVHIESINHQNKIMNEGQ